MNEEFNLDQFREDFNSIEKAPQKSAQQITRLLNKNSIDNAKYILIISIIEFVLFLSFFVWELASPQSADFNTNSFQIPSENLKLIEQFTQTYRIVYGVFTLISLGFILSFIRLYKKMRIDESIKKFTDDIVRYRNLSKYFIAFNVMVFVIFWTSITLFFVNQVESIFQAKHIDLPTNATWMMYGFSFIVFAVVLTLIAIYYRYLWGMFLGRLKRNQQELEEIRDLQELE